MRFTKMHGAGNDYVYVDRFRETLPDHAATLAEIARRISDRHTGVGGDGLILIEPPSATDADARMRMFNADGSEAEMCGNGIRCIAKYLYERGTVRKQHLRIETGRGIVETEVRIEAGTVSSVRVNMGRPVLGASEIPCTLPGDPPIDVPLEGVPTPEFGISEHCGEGNSSPGPAFASGTGSAWPSQSLRVTCVSMGNPHCVTFVNEPSDAWVLGVGPRIEKHAAFPNRVNVEFVELVSRAEIRVRVWERGTGETQACGTGACAVLVAGVLSGRMNREVLAHFSGGDLRLEWPESGDVFLTGPAIEVFSGEWSLPSASILKPANGGPWASHA